MAVVALQLGMPLLGFLGKHIFLRWTGESKDQSKALDELSREMREGFKETQKLISDQSREFARLEATVEHLERDLESLKKQIRGKGKEQ